MSVQTFRYKPKSTFWVTIEVTVDCCCSEKPIVTGRVYGFKHFGIFLSYEDKIETHLHSWKIIESKYENCEKAIHYELEIRFLISCEIGLGVGIGNFGTGTFGFPTRSVNETVSFETESICCDSEIENQKKIQSMFQVNIPPNGKRSSIPLVLALSVIGGTAILLKNLDLSGNFADYFIITILTGVLVSGCMVYWRIRSLAKGISSEKERKTQPNQANSADANKQRG